MEKFCFILIFICLFLPASAMKLSGNLQLAKPTEIEILAMDGTSIMKVPLKENGKFQSQAVTIVPDVYTFKIGKSKELIYLDNKDITINGYLDVANPNNSQLDFAGMEANDRFTEQFKLHKQNGGNLKSLKALIENQKIDSNLASALALLTAPVIYEDAKPFLDAIPKGKLVNASYKKFSKHVDSLSQYRLGSPCPPFSLTDSKGKTVKLSDFKGKYVVLDFWASWCGPCKNAIKQMKEFYPEFEKNGIVFVSISLDDTKDKWEAAHKEAGIPWVSLWDPSGGFYKTKMKEQYGFAAIPFIVIVDKKGNQLVRSIHKADDLSAKLKELK